MAEWFYKATNTKLDHVGTLLLTNRGFLCRSAFSDAGNWIANVQAVDFDDVIHIYFVGKNAVPLGAFKVIRQAEFSIPKPVPTAADFTGPIPGCALYEVVDPTFIKQLDPHNDYRPDPKLGKYTGWLIRKIGPAVPAPPKFLKEQPTLVRL